MTLEFHITRHDHLEGARLSLSGDFCNIPFEDVAAAEAEAERLANGRPYTIERRRYPALPPYRGKP